MAHAKMKLDAAETVESCVMAVRVLSRACVRGHWWYIPENRHRSAERRTFETGEMLER
jgi:hypothetical protein